MSKINLSKAKTGDKFRTRDGLILTYDKEYINRGIHILYKESGIAYLFLENGNYMVGEEMHPLDLVEQVFDKGDLLDNNISAEEGVQAIVEMAKSEYDKAKELGVAIQNLPYTVEQPKEDNSELQRRQEVVELADRIFFSERGSAYSFKECIEVAEHSVNMISQYLKEGKL